MQRDTFMQALADHRVARPHAIAVGGYRGHAHNLERWVGVVLWAGLVALLVAGSP